MAGLRALFRRVAQAVEEEAARQRGDDPSARPGYSTYHDREQPQPDAMWEPERETAHTPPRAWRAKTTRSPWSREQSESPAPTSATRRSPETHRAQPTDLSPWDTVGSSYAHASPTHAPLARIRARLGTPDALREAFVIREILDRPLARRRAR